MTMKDFITYCREVAEINRAFGAYLNELAGTLEAGGLSAGPLTLKELREMDGEPVWCTTVIYPERAGWYLVNASAQEDCEFIAVGKERGIPCAGIETGFWQAYRRRPAEAVEPPAAEAEAPEFKGRLAEAARDAE